MIQYTMLPFFTTFFTEQASTICAFVISLLSIVSFGLAIVGIVSKISSIIHLSL